MVQIASKRVTETRSSYGNGRHVAHNATFPGLGVKRDRATKWGRGRCTGHSKRVGEHGLREAERAKETLVQRRRRAMNALLQGFVIAATKIGEIAGLELSHP